MADRTMKITEGDNKTTVEGEGVEVLRDGKEWVLDTDAARVFLTQLLDRYEDCRVNIHLSVEFAETEGDGD